MVENQNGSSYRQQVSSVYDHYNNIKNNITSYRFSKNSSFYGYLHAIYKKRLSFNRRKRQILLYHPGECTKTVPL